MTNRSLQQQYLSAIGIQTWLLKATPQVEEEPDNELLPELDELPVITPVEVSVESSSGKNSGSESDDQLSASLPVIESVEQQSYTTASVPSESSAFLKPERATDDNHFSENELHSNNTPPESPAIETSIAKPSVTISAVNTSAVSELTIENNTELSQLVAQCHTCPERSHRLNSLTGQGSSNASVLFITDAPNADEDSAGHYLDSSGLSLFKAMTKSIGIADNYYYTGIVKCHSLQDFVVSAEDIEQCSGFIEQQVEQIKPDLIVILGVNPARALLRSSQTFNELRGHIHQLNINKQTYPAIVSYHPAYLLRNPLYKRQAFSDLLLIKQHLNDCT